MLKHSLKKEIKHGWVFCFYVYRASFRVTSCSLGALIIIVIIRVRIELEGPIFAFVFPENGCVRSRLLYLRFPVYFLFFSSQPEQLLHLCSTLHTSEGECPLFVLCTTVASLQDSTKRVVFHVFGVLSDHVYVNVLSLKIIY